MIDLFILISATSINAILGLLVLFYNAKPLVNKVFVGAVFFQIAFAVANYFIDNAVNNELGLLAFEFFIVFGHTFTYLLFLFIFLFGEEDYKSILLSPIHILTFLYTVIFVPIVTLSNQAFTAVSIGPKGLEHITFGPMYMPMFIGILILTILNFTLLFYRLVHVASHKIKRQLQYILIGWALFILSIIIIGGILPFFIPAAVTASKAVPLFSIFMVGFSTYAIFKYEFLDIRIIVQRGLIYTFIFVFIALLYSTALITLGALFSTQSVINQLVSGMLVTIIALITVPKIDRKLRKMTDPIFFKDYYDYRSTLHELSEILQSSLEMSELVTACEKKIQNTLRSGYVHITGKSESSTEDDTLYIPMKLQGKLTGLIIVGPKKSGDKYTPQDRQLLQTFANQAATAMSRVLLYQEVKKRAEELEMRVIERTTELQKLQENQKGMMLQLSHNLQTPLAILQTKIDELKSLAGMEKTAEGLTRSLREVSSFISDLLRYARLESKQTEFTFSKINLSELLQEIVEETSIIATAKNISVTDNIEPNLQIEADERKLREVCMNIISNAIKYMGSTQKDNSVNVLLKKQNDSINIAISDTGVGLTEDQQTKVFDRFYRAGGNDNGGTGLGLSISKYIVEAHGGTISVSSTKGDGSTFTIKLPSNR